MCADGCRATITSKVRGQVSPPGLARDSLEAFPLIATESVLIISNLQVAGCGGPIFVLTVWTTEHPGKQAVRHPQALRRDKRFTADIHHATEYHAFRNRGLALAPVVGLRSTGGDVGHFKVVSREGSVHCRSGETRLHRLFTSSGARVGLQNGEPTNNDGQEVEHEPRYAPGADEHHEGEGIRPQRRPAGPNQCHGLSCDRCFRPDGPT